MREGWKRERAGEKWGKGRKWEKERVSIVCIENYSSHIFYLHFYKYSKKRTIFRHLLYFVVETERDWKQKKPFTRLFFCWNCAPNTKRFKNYIFMQIQSFFTSFFLRKRYSALFSLILSFYRWWKWNFLQTMSDRFVRKLYI